jgi:hypothetical protein
VDDNSHQKCPLSININSTNEEEGEGENRKVKIKFVNPIHITCHAKSKHCKIPVQQEFIKQSLLYGNLNSKCYYKIIINGDTTGLYSL